MFEKQNTMEQTSSRLNEMASKMFPLQVKYSDQEVGKVSLLCGRNTDQNDGM